MNPIDDQLDRLLRAGRKATTEVGAPPFGLETRVLAAWREGTLHHDLWNPVLLGRALLAACGIAALSFWPVLNGNSNPTADYLQLADSTLLVSNGP